MAPLLETLSGHTPAAGLMRLTLVTLVVVAVVIAAAVAFGWTLPAGPSFELTPDPAGDLPF